MYSSGQGVPQDFAEAARWYRKAADQGLAEAQANLGDLYFKGRGVTQDNAEAHMWLSIAALRARGDDLKKYEAARESVAKRMTRSRLPKRNAGLAVGAETEPVKRGSLTGL